MGRLLTLLALLVGWVVITRWWAGSRRQAGGAREAPAGDRTAQPQGEDRAAYQAGYRAGAAAAAADAGARNVGRPTTRAEALAILGLPADAGRAAIEERYRELRASGHPDAVRSKKLPAAVVAFAEEHFKLVGEAYDLLTR